MELMKTYPEFGEETSNPSSQLLQSLLLITLLLSTLSRALALWDLWEDGVKIGQGAFNSTPGVAKVGIEPLLRSVVKCLGAAKALPVYVLYPTKMGSWH